MLRAALNISWKNHPTNKEIYGNIPRLTDTIRYRRLRFAGHIWRNKEELASDLLLWRPTHGRTSVGRPALNYINQLADDIGCLPQELPSLMQERGNWKGRVDEIRVSSIR